MKPRLLDLFCGAGGATRGYQKAGFYVIGVDINPQPNYCGDRFIQADAVDHLSEAYDLFCPFNYVDAIHASPPCQKFSSITHVSGDREEHDNLIDPIRAMLTEISAEGVPYVIENVPGSPLLDPFSLYGDMFGLGVKRRRLFETNFPVPVPQRQKDMPKKYRVYDHGKWYDSAYVPVYGSGGGKAKEHWAEAMGIDWMTHAEMAQAIPPAYTEHIGRALLAHLR